MAEVAVDEWVDAAVAGTEPLRQRSDVAVQQSLLEAAVSRRRAEQSAHFENVQGQPGCGRCCCEPELSMGWVDSWVGLGWVHYRKSTKNLKGLC